MHQTPINQEQSKQPSDICDVQTAFPINLLYSRGQRASGVRIHPYS